MVRRMGPRLFTRIAKNFDYFKFIRAVHARIRDLRPALIYAHDARAMAATAIANRTFGIPVVYRCHDIYEDFHPWHSLQGYIERYAARAGVHARLVIQYSRGRAEHFRTLAKSPYPNMIVSPNYASIELQPDLRDLDGLIVRRFERKHIVYPGVVNRFVALDNAVRALALLDKVWSMLMFGEADLPTLDGATQLAIDLGIERRLSHGGWIPPADVLRATNLGTVGLVLFKPLSVDYSSMATASNKLWEFAARGIPVAVPDTPDYRETLGEEAWVAFYGLEDPASLANAIVRLTASQKEYREASQAAYEAVRSKYNFESVFPPVLSGLLAATSNSDSHHALEQSSPIVFD